MKESIWDSIKAGDIFKGVVEEVRDFGSIIRLDWDTCGVVNYDVLKKLKKQLNPS